MLHQSLGYAERPLLCNAVSGPLVFKEKDQAEDMAYTLSQARWQRQMAQCGGKDI